MHAEAPAGFDARAHVLAAAELADRMRKNKAEFAETVHRAYVAGASLRQLAAATGISHEQIRRIVLAHRPLLGVGPKPSLPRSDQVED